MIGQLSNDFYEQYSLHFVLDDFIYELFWEKMTLWGD